MKALLFLIPLITFIGCSSKQEVIVTKQLSDAPPVQLSSFKEYSEALFNADFTQAEKLSAGEEQRLCVKAYELFAKGDEKQSEQILASLIASQDSLLKSYAEDLLSHIYFSRSRWNELLEMSNGQNSDDAADRILSKAFSSLPKEELSFNNSAVKYPIDLSSTGTPVVEVEVNGVKKKFWFDTGAGLTVIASDAAEECNVKEIGKDTASSGTATSIQVPFLPAEIKEFKFAGVNVKHHPVMILNKKDLEFKMLGFITLFKIDGIIGWNLIQQLGWEVDYKNKTIAPFSSDERTKSQKMNFSWFGYPLVLLSDLSGRELLFGLDTGAKNSSLSQHYIVPDSSSAGESESRTYGGAGGFEKAEVQKIKNVSLCLTGCRLFFPEIYKKSHNVTSIVKVHGILGSDFPAEGKLILDYPRRRLVLE